MKYLKVFYTQGSQEFIFCFVVVEKIPIFHFDVFGICTANACPFPSVVLFQDCSTLIL